MLTIQILGIGCKKSRALKANLLAALDSLPIYASVQEVVTVNDIIQYQISSTPALLVNQEIVSEGHVLGVREIRNILEQRYHTQLTMEKMLVPTDFSSTAANAFRFAIALTGEHALEMTLLHVYHPYFDPDNPMDGTQNAKQAEGTMKRMSQFIGENTSPASPNSKVLANAQLKKETQFGFAADELVKCSKQFDLVVMGTTGDGDLLEQLFGSVSSHVAQHAHCPVLLIPKNATFQGFNTVVFASDDNEADKRSFQHIAGTMDFTSADVHFVHVEKKSDDGFLFTNVKQEQLQQITDKKIKLTAAEIISENVLKALDEYVAVHQADLLIMRTKQRNFLEKVFHKSMTKQVILKADIPILVLHAKD